MRPQRYSSQSTLDISSRLEALVGTHYIYIYVYMYIHVSICVVYDAVPKAKNHGATVHHFRME